MTLTVTVIIPTHNRSHYLGESIDAVLGQSRMPDRIVVIDDGSTDDTKRVVARYGQRLEYVYQENAGKAAALNAAFANTETDTIWIVDDDDIVAPDALAALQDKLNLHRDAGFAYGGYDNFSVDHIGEKVVHTGVLRLPNESDIYASLLIDNAYIFHPAMLVRRSSYAAVGPFDTRLVRAQDYDMLLRLARSCKGAAIEGILFHQRQHSGDRGSGAHRINGAQVWQLQGGFDAAVVEKNYRAADLADYLPVSSRVADLQDKSDLRTRALLRRATASVRRGLWHLGLQDLAVIGELGAPSDAYTAEAALVNPVWTAIRRDGSADIDRFLRGVGSVSPAPTIATLQRVLARVAVRAAWASLRAGDRRSACRSILSAASIAGWGCALTIGAAVAAKAVKRRVSIIR